MPFFVKLSRGNFNREDTLISKKFVVVILKELEKYGCIVLGELNMKVLR